MRALLGLGLLGALLSLACGSDSTSNSCSTQCDDLWNEALTCWREYCQLDGGNTLFCNQCLASDQSLDGATCTCSGLAKDSFMDACCSQEPGKARFDCSADKKRIADLEEKWQCCLVTDDCPAGKTCGEDHHCK